MFAEDLKLKKRAKKLQNQNVGPFKVLQIIRYNTAKLELTLAVRVHLMFNVALLKKY